MSGAFVFTAGEANDSPEWLANAGFNMNFTAGDGLSAQHTKNKRENKVVPLGEDIRRHGGAMHRLGKTFGGAEFPSSPAHGGG